MFYNWLICSTKKECIKMNAVRTRSLFPLPKIQLNAVLVLGVILVIALFSFEVFNYSTTEYALLDLLGSLNFIGIKWATILTIAFCGIDFAGISRLFLTGQQQNEPAEAWYLFGAWMLSASMNAALTWWGVSMAILNHPIQSTSILDNATIVRVVPIFVALMVWLIRIMAIGTVATAGENIFRSPRRTSASSGVSTHRSNFTEEIPASARPVNRPLAPHMVSSMRPVDLQSKKTVESEKEPTYHRF
jgi:hypothetical protein